jgi:hypothetical protein
MKIYIILLAICLIGAVTSISIQNGNQKFKYLSTSNTMKITKAACTTTKKTTTIRTTIRQSTTKKPATTKNTTTKRTTTNKSETKRTTTTTKCREIRLALLFVVPIFQPHPVILADPEVWTKDSNFDYKLLPPVAVLYASFQFQLLIVLALLWSLLVVETDFFKKIWINFLVVLTCNN